MDLGTLTDSQREAVVRLGDPSFIMAGAGTGKTFTLSKKIAYQMTEPEFPLSPENLMAITFTEAAAAELQDRVRREAEKAGAADASHIEAAWISTIHSMCRRLLSENALDADIDPGLVVLSQAQADSMMEESVDAAVEQAEPQAVSEAVSLLRGYPKLREIVSEVLAVSARVPGGASRIDFGPLEHFFLAEEIPAVIDVIDKALPVYRNAATSKSGKTAATLEGDIEELSRARQALSLGDFDNAVPALYSRVKDIAEAKAEVSEAVKSLGVRFRVDSTLDTVSTLKGICIRAEREFRSRLHDANRMTFDALLSQSYGLLEDDSLSLDYSKRFDTIMVDEFQDTDALQFAIVERLCADEAGLGKLTAVGDRQQSIYSFRGADLQVSDDAQKLMESSMEAGEATIPLDMNFRSNPDILSFVGDIFSAPAFFGEKFLDLVPGEANASFAIEDGTPAVEVYAAPTSSKTGGAQVALAVEAQHIAARFKELHDNQEISYDSMALLLRSFTNVKSYISAFEAAGIPSAITGGRRFYSFSETMAAMDFMRVLDDPTSDDVLLRLLSGEMFSISDADLATLKEIYNTVNPVGCEEKVCLYSVMGEHVPSLPDAVAAAYSTISEAFKAIETQPLSRVFNAAVEASGWRASAAMEPATAFGKLANISKFADKLSEFDSLYGLDHSSIFEELFQAADAASGFGGRDNAETPGRFIGSGGDGCVSIMTIHASKGLEFDVVAISRAESNSPSETVLSASRARGSERVMELGMNLANQGLIGFEESDGYIGFLSRLIADHETSEAAEAQRLLYVALTRAKSKLIWTSTVNYTNAGKLGAAGKLFQSSMEAAFGEDWDKPKGIEQGCIVSTGSGTPVKMGLLEVPESLPAPAGRRVVQRAFPQEFTLIPFEAKRPASQEEEDARSFSSSYEGVGLSAEAMHFLGVPSKVDTPYREGGHEGAKEFGSAFHEVARRSVLRGALPKESEIRAIAFDMEVKDNEHDALVELSKRFWSEMSDVVMDALDNGSLAPEIPMGFTAKGEYFTGVLDLLSLSGRQATVVDYKTGLAGLDDAQVLSIYGYQALIYAASVLMSGKADEVRVEFLLVENDMRRVRCPKWTGDDLSTILDLLCADLEG